MPLDRLATLSIDVLVNANRSTRQLASTVYWLERAKKEGNTTLQTFNRLGSVLALASAVRSLQLYFEIMKGINKQAAILQKQIGDIEKIANTGSFDNVAKAFFEFSDRNRSANFREISNAMQEAARAGNTTIASISALAEAGVRLAATSGDITSGQATKNLARFAANTGIATNKVDNLASAIDVLSDNFPTTSGEILRSSARMTGFAETVGLTSQQLIALNAVLLSSGASATTVRTTLTKLFQGLTANTAEYGEALGLAGKELDEFIGSVAANPFQGMQNFLQRVNDLPLGKQVAIMKQLGLASSRVQNVLGQLRNAMDKVQDATKLANNEFNNGTALIRKYNKELALNATTIVDLEKNWTKFLAAISNSDFTRMVNQYVKGLTKFTNLFGSTPLTPQKPIDAKNIKDVNKEIDSTLKALDKIAPKIQALRKQLSSVIGGLFTGLNFGFSSDDIKLRSLNAEQDNLIKRLDKLLELRKAFREKEAADQKKGAEAAKEAAEAEKRRAQAIKEAKAAREAELAAQRKIAGQSLERQLRGSEASHPMDRFRLEYLDFVDKVRKANLDQVTTQNMLTRALALFNAKVEKLNQSEFETGFNDLSSRLGRFSNVIDVLTAFEKARFMIEKRFPGIDLKNLTALQLRALAPQTTPKQTQFRGLTQAYKDAFKVTQKKDNELAKAQLAIARQLVQKATKENQLQIEANKTLDAIEDKLDLEIK